MSSAPITAAQFEAYRDTIAFMRTATIRAGLEWDGRLVWQSMKAILSEEPTDQSWNLHLLYGKRDQFTSQIVVELEEADENGTTNELNHFMLQCCRIPMLNNPSPRKIMQIALNIGQLISEIELVGLQRLSPEFGSFYRIFCQYDMHEFAAYVELE